MALYPSEIARLVLGYLKETDCWISADLFLSESKHLQEHRNLIKTGKFHYLSVNGKTLLDYLDEVVQGRVINRNKEKSSPKELKKFSDAGVQTEEDQEVSNKKFSDDAILDDTTEDDFSDDTRDKKRVCKVISNQTDSFSICPIEETFSQSFSGMTLKITDSFSVGDKFFASQTLPNVYNVKSCAIQRRKRCPPKKLLSDSLAHQKLDNFEGCSTVDILPMDMVFLEQLLCGHPVIQKIAFTINKVLGNEACEDQSIISSIEGSLCTEELVKETVAEFESNAFIRDYFSFLCCQRDFCLEHRKSRCLNCGDFDAKLCLLSKEAQEINVLNLEEYVSDNSTVMPHEITFGPVSAIEEVADSNLKSTDFDKAQSDNLSAIDNIILDTKIANINDGDSGADSFDAQNSVFESSGVPSQSLNKGNISNSINKVPSIDMSNDCSLPLSSEQNFSGTIMEENIITTSISDVIMPSELLEKPNDACKNGQFIPDEANDIQPADSQCNTSMALSLSVTSLDKSASITDDSSDIKKSICEMRALSSELDGKQKSILDSMKEIFSDNQTNDISLPIQPQPNISDMIVKENLTAKSKVTMPNKLMKTQNLSQKSLGIPKKSDNVRPHSLSNGTPRYAPLMTVFQNSNSFQPLNPFIRPKLSSTCPNSTYTSNTSNLIILDNLVYQVVVTPNVNTTSSLNSNSFGTSLPVSSSVVSFHSTTGNSNSIASSNSQILSVCSSCSVLSSSSVISASSNNFIVPGFSNNSPTTLLNSYVPVSLNSTSPTQSNNVSSALSNRTILPAPPEKNLPLTDNVNVPLCAAQSNTDLVYKALSAALGNTLPTVSNKVLSDTSNGIALLAPPGKNDLPLLTDIVNLPLYNANQFNTNSFHIPTLNNGNIIQIPNKPSDVIVGTLQDVQLVVAEDVKNTGKNYVLSMQDVDNPIVSVDGEKSKKSKGKNSKCKEESMKMLSKGNHKTLLTTNTHLEKRQHRQRTKRKAARRPLFPFIPDSENLAPVNVVDSLLPSNESNLLSADTSPYPIVQNVAKHLSENEIVIDRTELLRSSKTYLRCPTSTSNFIVKDSNSDNTSNFHTESSTSCVKNENPICTTSEPKELHHSFSNISNCANFHINAANDRKTELLVSCIDSTKLNCTDFSVDETAIPSKCHASSSSSASVNSYMNVENEKTTSYLEQSIINSNISNSIKSDVVTIDDQTTEFLEFNANSTIPNCMNFDIDIAGDQTAVPLSSTEDCPEFSGIPFDHEFNCKSDEEDIPLAKLVNRKGHEQSPDLEDFSVRDSSQFFQVSFDKAMDEEDVPLSKFLYKKDHKRNSFKKSPKSSCSKKGHKNVSHVGSNESCFISKVTNEFLDNSCDNAKAAKNPEGVLASFNYSSVLDSLNFPQSIECTDQNIPPEIKSQCSNLYASKHLSNSRYEIQKATDNPSVRFSVISPLKSPSKLEIDVDSVSSDDFQYNDSSFNTLEDKHALSQADKGFLKKPNDSHAISNKCTNIGDLDPNIKSSKTKKQRKNSSKETTKVKLLKEVPQEEDNGCFTKANKNYMISKNCKTISDFDTNIKSKTKQRKNSSKETKKAKFWKQANQREGHDCPKKTNDNYKISNEYKTASDLDPNIKSSKTKRRKNSSKETANRKLLEELGEQEEKHLRGSCIETLKENDSYLSSLLEDSTEMQNSLNSASAKSLQSDDSSSETLDNIKAFLSQTVNSCFKQPSKNHNVSKNYENVNDLDNNIKSSKTKQRKNSSKETLKRKSSERFIEQKGFSHSDLASLKIDDNVSIEMSPNFPEEVKKLCATTSLPDHLNSFCNETQIEAGNSSACLTINCLSKSQKSINPVSSDTSQSNDPFVWTVHNKHSILSHADNGYFNQGIDKHFVSKKCENIGDSDHKIKLSKTKQKEKFLKVTLKKKIPKSFLKQKEITSQSYLTNLKTSDKATLEITPDFSVQTENLHVIPSSPEHLSSCGETRNKLSVSTLNRDDTHFHKNLCRFTTESFKDNDPLAERLNNAQVFLSLPDSDCFDQKYDRKWETISNSGQNIKSPKKKRKNSSKGRSTKNSLKQKKASYLELVDLSTNDKGSVGSPNLSVEIDNLCEISSLPEHLNIASTETQAQVESSCISSLLKAPTESKNNVTLDPSDSFPSEDSPPETLDDILAFLSHTDDDRLRNVNDSCSKSGEYKAIDVKVDNQNVISETEVLLRHSRKQAAPKKVRSLKKIKYRLRKQLVQKKVTSSKSKTRTANLDMKKAYKAQIYQLKVSRNSSDERNGKNEINVTLDPSDSFPSEDSPPETLDDILAFLSHTDDDRLRNVNDSCSKSGEYKAIDVKVDNQNVILSETEVLLRHSRKQAAPKKVTSLKQIKHRLRKPFVQKKVTTTANLDMKKAYKAQIYQLNVSKNSSGERNGKNGILEDLPKYIDPENENTKKWHRMLKAKMQNRPKLNSKKQKSIKSKFCRNIKESFCSKEKINTQYFDCTNDISNKNSINDQNNLNYDEKHKATPSVSRTGTLDSTCKEMVLFPMKKRIVFDYLKHEYCERFNDFFTELLLLIRHAKEIEQFYFKIKEILVYKFKTEKNSKYDIITKFVDNRVCIENMKTDLALLVSTFDSKNSDRITPSINTFKQFCCKIRAIRQEFERRFRFGSKLDHEKWRIKKDCTVKKVDLHLLCLESNSIKQSLTKKKSTPKQYSFKDPAFSLGSELFSQQPVVLVERIKIPSIVGNGTELQLCEQNTKNVKQTVPVMDSFQDQAFSLNSECFSRQPIVVVERTSFSSVVIKTTDCTKSFDHDSTHFDQSEPIKNFVSSISEESEKQFLGTPTNVKESISRTSDSIIMPNSVGFIGDDVWSDEFKNKIITIFEATMDIALIVNCILFSLFEYTREVYTSTIDPGNYFSSKRSESLGEFAIRNESRIFPAEDFDTENNVEQGESPQKRKKASVDGFSFPEQMSKKLRVVNDSVVDNIQNSLKAHEESNLQNELGSCTSDFDFKKKSFKIIENPDFCPQQNLSNIGNKSGISLKTKYNKEKTYKKQNNKETTYKQISRKFKRSNESKLSFLKKRRHLKVIKKKKFYTHGKTFKKLYCKSLQISHILPKLKKLKSCASVIDSHQEYLISDKAVGNESFSTVSDNLNDIRSTYLSSSINPENFVSVSKKDTGSERVDAASKEIGSTPQELIEQTKILGTSISKIADDGFGNGECNIYGEITDVKYEEQTLNFTKKNESTITNLGLEQSNQSKMNGINITPDGNCLPNSSPKAFSYADSITPENQREVLSSTNPQPQTSPSRISPPSSNFGLSVLFNTEEFLAAVGEKSPTEEKKRQAKFLMDNIKELGTRRFLELLSRYK